jgi:hypothetical protein
MELAPFFAGSFQLFTPDSRTIGKILLWINNIANVTSNKISKTAENPQDARTPRNFSRCRSHKALRPGMSWEA